MPSQCTPHAPRDDYICRTPGLSWGFSIPRGAHMLNKALAWCAAQSPWKVLVWGLLLALVIEGFTVVLRFGLHLESTRDTASTIGTMTFGLRIHHGYIGLFLLPLAWCFPLGIRHAVWIVAYG